MLYLDGWGGVPHLVRSPTRTPPPPPPGRAVEAVGLAPAGQGGAWVERTYQQLFASEAGQQQQQPQRRVLPVNTHGGLLGFGAPWEVPAMHSLIEAVEQLRGEASGRQVRGRCPASWLNAVCRWGLRCTMRQRRTHVAGSTSLQKRASEPSQTQGRPLLAWRAAPRSPHRAPRRSPMPRARWSTATAASSAHPRWSSLRGTGRRLAVVLGAAAAAAASSEPRWQCFFAGGVAMLTVHSSNVWESVVRSCERRGV